MKKFIAIFSVAVFFLAITAIPADAANRINCRRCSRTTITQTNKVIKTQIVRTNQNAFVFSNINVLANSGGNFITSFGGDVKNVTVKTGSVNLKFFNTSSINSLFVH